MFWHILWSFVSFLVNQ